MSEFDNLFDVLCAYINDLETKFIERFIPTDPTVSATEYALDVRAYCVLSHAAFEEFFEEVSLKVMARSIIEWQGVEDRRINDALLTLASYSAYKFENASESTSPFDYLREVLGESKKRLSRNVIDNHGMSPRHLTNILLPVALQIKQEINLQNSLSQLVKQRGDYAHRGSIKSILSPEDAKKYVADCLLLCEDIRDKANAKFLN